MYERRAPGAVRGSPGRGEAGAELRCGDYVQQLRIKSQVKLSRLNRFTSIQSSPCDLPRAALRLRERQGKKNPKQNKNQIKPSPGLEMDVSGRSGCAGRPRGASATARAVRGEDRGRAGFPPPSRLRAVGAGGGLGWWGCPAMVPE